MTRWILRILEIGTLMALLVAFGPGLVRTDQITFEVARAFGEGELLEPVSVLFVADRGAGDRVYVSDAGHNRIVVFDTAGTVLDRWEAPLYDLRRPMHLTLGSDGLIRVSEYLTDRVTVLTPSGELLEQIGGETGDGAGQLDAPSGVAELGGLLFIPDFYNHRVQVFGGGNLSIGRSGRVLNGFLHYPTDVATDDSLVFVADAYNHRVQVFRPDGSFVRAWGGPH